MIPKGKLLALLLAFTAVGGIAATGAFTTVEAERTADVSVDGDANALLAIEPIPNPDNSDFVTQSDTNDETFEIVLDNAVNARASTTSEDLVNITNNGEEPVDVWIATQGGKQETNTTINTSFYISSEHINSSAGAGDVAPSGVSTNPDPKPLSADISTYQAFVDGDGTTTSNSDAVISEVEADGSEDQSPGNAAAVSIAPGESITVSFAVEIDGEADTLTDDNDAVLDNIVIFAVNDDEDGSADIDQELATSPGTSDETSAS